jgi:hypothetical protein
MKKRFMIASALLISTSYSFAINPDRAVLKKAECTRQVTVLCENGLTVRARVTSVVEYEDNGDYYIALGQACQNATNAATNAANAGCNTN